MPDLRDTRKRVKIALTAMVVLDVAAVVVFFSPLVGSAETRRENLNQLWRELQVKTREVEPLQTLPKKIPLARKEIDQFYDQRLPSENSVIAESIGKVASETGIKIESIKYSVKDPEAVGLRPVEIEANLAGGYLQLVRFINAIERDQTFFLVNNVTLGGEQAGVVKLELKMETFLKTSG